MVKFKEIEPKKPLTSGCCGRLADQGLCSSKQ